MQFQQKMLTESQTLLAKPNRALTTDSDLLNLPGSPDPFQKEHFPPLLPTIQVAAVTCLIKKPHKRCFRSHTFPSTESDYSAALQGFAILAFTNQVLSRQVGGLQDPRFGMIEIVVLYFIFGYLSFQMELSSLSQPGIKDTVLALKICSLSLNYNPFVLGGKNPAIQYCYILKLYQIDLITIYTLTIQKCIYRNWRWGT